MFCCREDDCIGAGAQLGGRDVTRGVEEEDMVAHAEMAGGRVLLLSLKPGIPVLGVAIVSTVGTAGCGRVFASFWRRTPQLAAGGVLEKKAEHG